MTLNKNEYFEAIEKSLSNAEELIEEAEILAKHTKYARAYTLFQFSIEEIGKAFLTFQFVLYGDIEDVQATKQFFKKFRDHISKTESSQSIDFMFALNSDISGFTKKLLENSMSEFDKVHISNNYKNYSLYTSFIEDKFYKPSEIITKEKLDKITYYTKLRLQIAKPFIKIGVENYDLLFNTRNDLDEEEMSKETQKRIDELLEQNFKNIDNQQEL